jgi:hypothetical protein
MVVSSAISPVTLWGAIRHASSFALYIHEKLYSYIAKLAGTHLRRQEEDRTVPERTVGLETTKEVPHGESNLLSD